MEAEGRIAQAKNGPQELGRGGEGEVLPGVLDWLPLVAAICLSLHCAYVGLIHGIDRDEVSP